MAAADDDRSDLDAAAGRVRTSADDTDLESAGNDHPVMKNIDRVADKVKGLLRSDG